MNPIVTAIKITKGEYKIVSGAKLSLENGAKGTTAATTVDQPAVIEVFEIGDKTKAIFTLTSTLKLVNDVPNFNLAAASPSRSIAIDDTDFEITLEFDTKTFPSGGVSVTFSLRLPFITRNLKLSPASVSNLTLGAQISIGGSLESAAFADKLDIPLLQLEVPDDFEPTVKQTLIGPASSGHPLSLLFVGKPLLKAGVTIPRVNTTFEVLLNDTVRNRCEFLVPGSFNLATIETFINQTFSPVGFAAVSLKEIPTDAVFNARWNSTGEKLFSTTVANPPNISNAGGEGHIVPFFQFLIHASIKLKGGSAELAEGEVLDSIQATAKTKRIISPITIACEPTASFNLLYITEEKTKGGLRLLANIIVHEIGHALGLSHCQEFDIAQKTRSVPSTIAVMSNDKPGQGMKKFGPVHTAVLQKAYP